jgi:hypothetical protein
MLSESWNEKLFKQGLLINLIALTFSVICFFPLFYHTSTTVGAASSVGDDYFDYYYSFPSDTFACEAAISTLIITLPSAFDLLVDMIPPSMILMFIDVDRRLLQEPTDKKAFHLTNLEKLLFIMGSMCMASISFTPVASDQNAGLIYNAFLNVSTILVICPLFSYLSRCSTTWTPLRSIFIVLLLCFGCFMCALSGVVQGSASSALMVACNALMTACCCLFFLGSLISWLRSLWRKNPENLTRNSCNGGGINGGPSKDEKQPRVRNTIKDENAEERFQDVVVAIHIITTFFYLLLTAVWYWYIYVQAQCT